MEPASSRGRLRALVAAGAATAVTAVAVGLAALAGPVGAPAPQIAGGPEGTDEQVATDDGVGTAGHGPAVPAPSVERAPWLSEWSHLFSAPPSGDTSGSEAGSRPQRDGDTADGADSASRDVGEATRDAGDAGSADGGADADETEDDATDPTGDESEADDRRLLDLEGLLRPEDADGRDDDPRGDALGDDDLDGRDEPEESQSGLSRTETEGRGPSLPGFGG